MYNVACQNCDQQYVGATCYETFNCFQDHKYRARIDGESQGQILVAKEQGNLHETLLDRREKIKSDRMCK